MTNEANDIQEQPPDGSDYNASSIQVLEGLEAVRKRPAMYIGDTAQAGLHHLIWEVVDNSVDEALQRRCDQIVVTIHKDSSVSVLDNGAGIPVDLHPKLGVPALEIILTKLHAGGKFDKGSYQVSGGLHGVGVSVVNALSEWLEVEVYRNGRVFRQTFERGAKTSELTELGESSKTGTLVRFKADEEIFQTTEIQYERVTKRMRELSYLMGTYGLAISLVDERSGEKAEFRHPNGLIDFVTHLNTGKEVLHGDVIHIHKIHTSEDRETQHEVEIALQYSNGYNETILSFVNNIHTVEGGTHLSGFKTALTRTLNQFAKKNNLIKEKEKQPSGDDLREGLTAIIAVKVPDPQFESQTKIRLGNRDVEGIVNTIFGEALRDYFEENPKDGKAIFEKAMQAARARDAARKARDQVRRKSAMENSTLPLKLVDCHRGTAREDAELFLVEGDSAGGTAVSGRASFQAILPLRGKILNVEKAPLHKVMDHREIEAIVAACGAGFVGEEFDPNKLRYHKIIIMTDADVDGSHIRTLLLTFFYRKMPALVRGGYVYVAQPPLYILRKGKKYEYVHTEEQREAAMMRFGLDSLGLWVDGREFLGVELERAVETIRAIEREAGKDARRSSVGVSEIIRTRNECGSWPTHQITVRSERLAGHAPKTLFVTGGEAELDEILGQMRADAEGLVVSFVGDANDQADVVVESIHVSKRLKELVERAAAMHLPLDLFDDASGETATIEVKVGSERSRVRTLSEALRVFGKRRDVFTQRFKGLGEMDDNQLWESAMDPAQRLLYRVESADEVDTDKLFTVLMGSVVEPRRQFIEKHSLDAKNLDI